LFSYEDWPGCRPDGRRPAERHLLRRQRYFVYLLQDIVYNGYKRAQSTRPRVPSLPSAVYRDLFAPAVPDVSRDDNRELGQAAETLTQVFKNLILESEPQSRTLTTELLRQVFRFMGEPQEAAKIEKMVDEIFSNVDGQSATGLAVREGEQRGDVASSASPGARAVVVNGRNGHA
jgi:hypothetical protein